MRLGKPLDQRLWLIRRGRRFFWLSGLICPATLRGSARFAGGAGLGIRGRGLALIRGRCYWPWRGDNSALRDRVSILILQIDIQIIFIRLGDRPPGFVLVIRSWNVEIRVRTS
jgi:hypothetical protein